MSDRDQWPDNPNEVSQQPSPAQGQKSGGGCLKAALIVGGIGLFGMVLCCGGLFIFGRQFIPKIVTTPAEVAVVGQEIMKIDIPDDFQGQMGMSMDNFAMTMKMATFQHKQQKGTLTIGAMQVKIGNPKDHQAVFNQQKAQQAGGQEGLTIRTTVDREITVRGKPTTFKFSEADQAGTGKKFRVVSSEFEAVGGMLMFQLTLEEDSYDEDAVVKMIESIQ